MERKDLTAKERIQLLEEDVAKLEAVADSEEKLDKLNQRIDQLEASVLQVVQAYNMDVPSQKQKTELIVEWIEALIKIINENKLPTKENINRTLIEVRVIKLTEMVDVMVKNGQLIATEEVNDKSFVVGEQLDAKTLEVVNPRLQMAVAMIENEAARNSLIGKKVTDEIDDGKNVIFKVLEVYNIVQPEQDASMETSDVPE